MNRNAVAIIPARGGSKRIERKNIIEVGGRPMIAWSIDAALRSGCFDRIVVSTDDEEIAAVARRYGADVPFLRARYADDISPVSMATIGTLEQLSSESSGTYETVVQLMPNCPLRDEHHIREAINNFEQRGANSQISCFRFGWMNPWWAVELDGDMRPQNLFPAAKTTRSQDLPPLYCPTGAVWVARVSHLLEHESFYTPDTIFCPMPWQPAVDIDDYEDLHMAEVLFNMRLKPA